MAVKEAIVRALLALRLGVPNYLIV
jgi:hypothetical protein